MNTHRLSVSSDTPWEPVAGYSRAVRIGPWVAVSGTTAASPTGPAECGDDIAEQTRVALARVLEALAAAGASIEDVVRTRMFVTDIARWEAVARVHGEVFGDVRPATSMVEVSALIDPSLLIEVEADAYVG
jgi:enamine deaminase RidA (YjgF/YER057c/UK114 family)